MMTTRLIGYRVILHKVVETPFHKEWFTRSGSQPFYNNCFTSISIWLRFRPLFRPVMPLMCALYFASRMTRTRVYVDTCPYTSPI